MPKVTSLLCAASLHRLGDSLRKRGLVGDQVVRGQHQQDRIFAMAGSNVERSRSNRGSSVPPEGFEDEAVGEIAVAAAGDLAVFVLGLEHEFAVGNGERLRDIRQGHAAQPGFLQQALSIRQTDERFGVQLAGNRPEPGACSAAQDRRDQFHRSATACRGLVRAIVLSYARDEQKNPSRAGTGELTLVLIRTIIPPLITSRFS